MAKTTMEKLREIRKREAELLLNEGKKVKKLRRINEEEEKLRKDIRRIREARNKNKGLRRKKAGMALKRIKETGKKIGKPVLRYLQAMRDSM